MKIPLEQIERISNRILDAIENLKIFKEAYDEILNEIQNDKTIQKLDNLYEELHKINKKCPKESYKMLIRFYLNTNNEKESVISEYIVKNFFQT